MGARIDGQNGLIPPDSGGIFGCGHTQTYAAQRLLTRTANAHEFARHQISPIPHPIGEPPQDAAFTRMQASGFADWRLQIDWSVQRPASVSIVALKSGDARSQITQLICEEGWSYIAEWTGVPLASLLQEAGILPQARFAVYHSMDGWHDAIDLDEALHPQTLVTCGFNGADLPVGHGGPLRLRIPKQLGYKSLKFLNRITLTYSLKNTVVGGSYSWYAGI